MRVRLSNFPLWWALIPVLLLAVWLAARSLNAEPLWGDEMSSVYDAGASFYGPLSPFGVWSRVASRNPWHAPGYFMLLNAWGRLVGWDSGALRMLSILIGLLAVAWTYRIGRDFVSPRAGLYAAVLLATSVLFLHYLDKVRMYTLIALLSALTFWVYMRVVYAPVNLTNHTNNDILPPLSRSGEGGRGVRFLWMGALLLCVIGSLYAHYLAAMPLVAIGLYHLIVAPKNRRWWQVTVLFALAGVLFLPWARYLVAGVGLATEAEELHALALNGVEVVTRFLVFLGNGVVALPLIALGLAALMRPAETRRLWFVALATLALVLLVNEAFQIIDERRMRYLIAVVPMLAVLMGAGLARLPWRGVAISIVVVWAALGVWHNLNATVTPMLDGYSYIFPLQRVTFYVRDEIQPDDVVLNFLPDAGLRANEYENIASFYFTPLPLAYLMAQGDAGDLVPIAAEHPRIYVAYNPQRQPTALDAFTDALETTHAPCGATLRRPDLAIDLYAEEGLC